MNFFDHIPIPRFAAVNYLRRVPDAVSDESIPFGNSYKNDWPALVFAKSNDPAPVYQCPANMHLTIINGPMEIVVRIFSPKSAAEHFDLMFDHSLPLHFPIFRKHGFSSEVPGGSGSGVGDSSQKLPPYSEVRLGPGEYLFLPNRVVSGTSFSPRDSEQVYAPYISLCSVDASNVNQFRDALSWYGLVSSHDAQLRKIMLSSNFDHSVDKSAPDMTYSSYTAASETLVSAPEKRSSDADPVKMSAAADDAAAKRDERRDRKKRNAGSSSDFKSWQDTLKWNLQIAAMTIAPPTAVELVDVGRDEVTIRWRSAFVPVSSDHTKFGFVVTYCTNRDQALRLRQVVLPFDRKGSLLEEGECSTTLFERVKNSASLTEKVDQDLLLRSGEHVTVFQATLRDLLSSTRYQLRVHSIYDQTETLPSSWSIPFTTLKRTPPSVPSPPLHQIKVDNSNLIYECSVMDDKVVEVERSSLAPIAVPKYSSGDCVGEFAPRIALYFMTPEGN